MRQIICLNNHLHLVIGKLQREMNNPHSMSWRDPQPCSIVYRPLLAELLGCLLKNQIPVPYFNLLNQNHRNQDPHKYAFYPQVIFFDEIQTV